MLTSLLLSCYFFPRFLWQVHNHLDKKCICICNHFVLILLLIIELQLQSLSRLLDKVFLLFPNYCLGMSFSQFYQNYETISFCTTSLFTKDICHLYSEYYLMNMTQGEAAFMLYYGVWYLTITSDNQICLNCVCVYIYISFCHLVILL